MVIASGARYRRLDVQNLASFEGASVHYWASPLEAQLCGGQEVALVGAGNSAGQAAVYLADRVAKVWMIVRGPSLDASMSRYLVDRIAATPNIEVLYNTSVSALDGSDGMLQAIRCRSQLSGDERSLAGSATCSCSSARTPIPTGWPAPASPSTTRASFVPAATCEARSKPICPAFSRSATYAAARSSGSPPRSVKARRSSRHCTRFWRRPTAGPCRPGSEELMTDECSHEAAIRDVTPSALGCEECLKIGSPWVHLRLCRTCGHVGCCDDSPNRHATRHFQATRHPVIEGYDPPEGWGWCYIDEVMLDLSDRATPHNGLIPRYY